MFTTEPTTSELAIVALAVFAISLGALYTLRKYRKKKMRLAKDDSGLWKYHKSTKFERYASWGKLLEKKSGSESSCTAGNAICCPKHRATSAPTKTVDVGSTSETFKTDTVNSPNGKVVAVISFHGDMKAKGREALSQAIDEVIINKDAISEVVIRIDSPGGLVSHYGHAFAELERVRTHNIPLTCCVDVVAASGGYLLSLPATKIIAAPFALVGSVGVVAFLPNIRQLLLNWNINPRTFTAGKFKRTLTLTDEASAEEVAHFQAQLESIHSLFLACLKKYRPHARTDVIETGDHWTAQQSVDLELNLVDQLGTSSDYLLERNKVADLLYIKVKRGLLEDSILSSLTRLAELVYTRLVLARPYV